MSLPCLLSIDPFMSATLPAGVTECVVLRYATRYSTGRFVIRLTSLRLRAGRLVLVSSDNVKLLPISPLALRDINKLKELGVEIEEKAEPTNNNTPLKFVTRSVTIDDPLSPSTIHYQGPHEVLAECAGEFAIVVVEEPVEVDEEEKERVQKIVDSKVDMRDKGDRESYYTMKHATKSGGRKSCHIHYVGDEPLKTPDGSVLLPGDVVPRKDWQGRLSTTLPYNSMAAARRAITKYYDNNSKRGDGN
jgi:hypothetical protein